MPKASDEPLPRREREAMDILHRLGEGGVAAVQQEMSGEPSYSAVRALLTLLADKKHVAVRKDPASRQYLYSPAQPLHRAQRGALGRLLDTFFGGSPSALVANLLDQKERQLPPEELERIRHLVEEYARRQTAASESPPKPKRRSR